MEDGTMGGGSVRDPSTGVSPQREPRAGWNPGDQLSAPVNGNLAALILPPPMAARTRLGD